MPLTLDITGDFSIVDNLETVTVTAKNNSDESVDSCFSTPIRTREIAASNGRYTAGDVRFHVPVDNTTAPPAVVIVPPTSGGEVYTILDVDNAGMSGIYKCGSRLLDIYNELNTLITVQVATWSKNANGVQAATWANEATSIRAKIQPATEQIETDEGARGVKKRFTIFLEAERTLDHDRRIVGPDSSIYKILAYQGRDRLDQLPSVLVELM